MLKLSMPFDEPISSRVAQDFSGFNNHATLGELDGFVEGRSGNSLFLHPQSNTIIPHKVIDFNNDNDFSVYFWLLARYIGGFPQFVGLYIKFVGLPDKVLLLNSDSQSLEWTHFVFTKSGQNLKLYVNSVLKDSFIIPAEYGKVKSFYFAERYLTGTPSIYQKHGALLDNLGIDVGVAYTPPEIDTIIKNDTTRLSYIINGRNLKDLGVYVEDAIGLTNRASYKNVKTYDWPDRHGIATDLRQVRFNSREIELKCWFAAAGRDETIDKIAEIKELLSKEGVTRFMFLATSRALPYDVYFPEEIEFETPKWVDRKMFTRFSIKMIEPEPVKMVLKWVKVEESSSDVSLSMYTNGELINVYWGDGTRTENIYGQNQTVFHHYENIGEYYINIAGVVEKITNVVSNAPIVWNKLY